MQTDPMDVDSEISHDGFSGPSLKCAEDCCLRAKSYSISQPQSGHTNKALHPLVVGQSWRPPHGKGIFIPLHWCSVGSALMMESWIALVFLQCY